MSDTKKIPVFVSEYSKARISEGRFYMTHIGDNEPNSTLVVFSGSPEQVYTASEMEAELQALRDRVAKLEAAGDAMDATLRDELGNLEEGDAEVGPQKYVDEEMARRIMDVSADWFAAKQNK